jgi:UDP-N-acetylmuramoyl-L-alanyl-D-glutamate--2,6-diaminopimelate ligase
MLKTQLKKSMSLRALLQDIAKVNSANEREITGLSADSRTIQSGDLFLATMGAQYDGRNFIHDALVQGAVAIVCEKNSLSEDMSSEIKNCSVPVILIKDLQKTIGHIAARFYNNPSQKMTIIGVTGTNGKTSCSQFIARCLQAANVPCGVIGTLGAGFPDKLISSALTTPHPIELQHQLAEFLEQGAKAVVMEVSSHSLVQDRVQAVEFDIAVFTNLTRDHLDYHGDMDNYANAKRMLFEKPGLQYAVINIDDSYGREYLSHLPKSLKIFGYSISDNTADIPVVRASHIEMAAKGFTAQVETPWGSGELRSHLLGRFNISNLLAVLTTLNLLKIPFAKTLEYLTALTTVPGRMQIFGGNKQPLVVVDYAHTPDALEKALTALREHCQ